MLVVAAMLAFYGCSNKPNSIDIWKGWVLTKAKVEDYTPMDLVIQFVDERTETAKYVDYHEKFEAWWFEKGDVPKNYTNKRVSDEDKMFEMDSEREDFNLYYYPVLAKLTLMNALCSDDESQDEGGIAEALSLSYLKMMGDEYIMMAIIEAMDEYMDLDNLRKLSREDLKTSMDEVIEENGISAYRVLLSTDEDNDEMWWGANNVARLAKEFEDEFFKNVMAILGDFSELEKMIDEAVSVYSCEYNSSMSSNKADVYDVIYSVKDKMYVKCSILESNGSAEIKINNKSTHLLSL